ncbi:MAG: hypothetical protein B7X95_04170 [Methylophilaceae bacterium 17-44-8]|jgi:hypothetical protein|nr:MAG: hypothetical protein B7Y48_08110 [Methylophilales bacterium 28-44-11]OZA06100.1 MAG: hypothetical protein B7X95_04170 [Methylophilaceae bacterium 17-44-8]
MRQPFIENEDNPLQQSVSLSWNTMRDAASDAVLRAPSIHAEVNESNIEAEVQLTLYASHARTVPHHKHLVFRKPRHP